MRKYLSLVLLTLSGCSSQDSDYWLKEVSKLNYTREQEFQSDWQTPEETIDRGGGDCEDLAILLQYYLENSGHKSNLVVGKYMSNSDEYHAWVESEGWILDPSLGIRIPSNSRRSFYQPIIEIPKK